MASDIFLCAGNARGLGALRIRELKGAAQALEVSLCFLNAQFYNNNSTILWGRLIGPKWHQGGSVIEQLYDWDLDSFVKGPRSDRARSLSSKNSTCVPEEDITVSTMMTVFKNGQPEEVITVSKVISVIKNGPLTGSSILLLFPSRRPMARICSLCWFAGFECFLWLGDACLSKIRFLLDKCPICYFWYMEMSEKSAGRQSRQVHLDMATNSCSDQNDFLPAASDISNGYSSSAVSNEWNPKWTKGCRNRDIESSVSIEKQMTSWRL